MLRTNTPRPESPKQSKPSNPTPIASPCRLSRKLSRQPRRQLSIRNSIVSVREQPRSTIERVNYLAERVENIQTQISLGNVPFFFLLASIRILNQSKKKKKNADMLLREKRKLKQIREQRQQVKLQLRAIRK